MNPENSTLPARGKRLLPWIVVTAVLVGLYPISLVNYLLFHTFVELFSIVVAFSLSLIVWHSRRYLQNSYLVFLGVAYLFIGVLDLLHTLSYTGMEIFAGKSFYANQLWVGARAMESLTLLAGFLYVSRPAAAIRGNFLLLRERTVPRFGWLMLGYAVVTALLVLSIFTWRIFPECFVEGQGQTPFKIAAEYVICLILLVSLFILYRHRQRFEPETYRMLAASIACTIVSELSFTFYLDNYGFSNLVGHYFKLFSFMLIQQAIVRTGIEQPHRLIFAELSASNEQLRHEVQARTRAEARKEELIGELQAALDEIKVLKGILPICMHCKKIRDDRGYWNQLESYIRANSQAEFSHSICPDCMCLHYPEIAEELEAEDRQDRE